MHAHRQTASAFTLLEVLLALALFSIASALLVQSATDALRAFEAVKGNANEEQFYRFVLRQALAVENQEEFEDGNDVLLPDERSAHWEAEVEDAGMVDLYQARITVEIEGDRFSSRDDAEPRVYAVYLYRPQWSAVDGDRADILEDRREAWEDRYGDR